MARLDIGDNLRMKLANVSFSSPIRSHAAMEWKKKSLWRFAAASSDLSSTSVGLNLRKHPNSA